jgi:alkyl hydroperoxide reductase subunit AhpC
MGLRINDTIPNLTVETDQGSFALHDWIGDSWAILFSHPKDFTPSARPSSAPWRGSPMSGPSAAPR